MNSTPLIDRAQLSPQEQANLAASVDYECIQTIPEIWAIASQRFGNTLATHDPHGSPALKFTYQELCAHIQLFAAGLQALGLVAEEHVALISDNSPRWLIADQGIMTAGGIDVVRGSQSDRDELLYILEHSDSVALVVQDNATLARLLPDLEGLNPRFVVLLSDETPAGSSTLQLLNFSQLLELGKSRELKFVQRQRNDVATLMYTSGTSGQPKGVMLSHGNLLSQVMGAAAVVRLQPGERVMSILPIWHCYERTFEYFIFSQGCSQIYTNIRQVKKDLKQFSPQYMVGVPRLWESIYDGIQKQFRDQPEGKQKLVNFFLTNSDRYIRAQRILAGLDLENLHPSGGQKLKAAAVLPVLWVIHQLGDRLVYRKIRDGLGGGIHFVVSGGGSIADHLEDFFEIVGINILGGYGLTETAPITNVRRPWRNLRGADGQPLGQTEVAIVDPETRQPLPVGAQGLVLIRGAQVMQGYYKNPIATQKAIDPVGWFDTGDLGQITGHQDLIITGRAKDTIVLTNGENIEPQPIEDACLRSPYVDQIMLVGQDQKAIGALVVPNLEALKNWAAKEKLPLSFADPADLTQKDVQNLFRQELNREVKNRPGFRPDDRIASFRLLDEPFSIENGLLTQTLKVKRPLVSERYRAIIDEMFI
ncbi:MAG: long-chain fatty acid--CoA ligase [Synechococcales cyanobacterium CRU_2_2]|nr:long-chain fatty acid--CoA ligase [Synechococcales cyanobacterium CRU_2_2]